MNINEECSRYYKRRGISSPLVREGRVGVLVTNGKAVSVGRMRILSVIEYTDYW